MSAVGKRVLLVAYDFPPVGGSGVQRMLKFVKHLPAHGWKITVLTVRTTQTIIDARDESLLAEIPSTVEVIRSSLIDPYDNVVFRAVESLGRVLGGGHRASSALPTTAAEHATNTERPKAAGTSAASGPRTAAAAKRGGSQRVLDFLHSLMVPDRYVGWLPYAFVSGARAIRRERPDLILTTSPCETAHVVGLLLSKLFSLPLVADFRDPWTGYYFALERPRPFDWLNRRLERAVLRRASLVVSTEAGCSRSLRHRVPGEPASKFEVITNGYDESDFAGVEPTTFGKYTIVFTGTVYAQVTPANVFAALRRLVQRDARLADDLQFVFVGNAYSGFDDLVRHHRLENVVYREGYLPHRDSVSRLLGADLAYYNVFSDLAITAKLFEYLRSGTDILATIPADHSAADIIRECSAGTVLPYDDIDGIEANIASRLDAYRLARAAGRTSEERSRDTPPAVRRYERQVLTSRLSERLSRVS